MKGRDEAPYGQALPADLMWSYGRGWGGWLGKPVLETNLVSGILFTSARSREFMPVTFFFE
jgi:hypothetical protein